MVNNCWATKEISHKSHTRKRMCMCGHTVNKHMQILYQVNLKYLKYYIMPGRLVLIILTLKWL